MLSNAFKCIFPKRAKKCQKMVKKITNNCKILEITKYGDKITKIDKNVKQCKQM